jgi:7-carboxy-7-deazaguanine synthase
MAAKNDTLNVVEIFKSIQGESTYSGLPFAFVRFSGCNLRCAYCDSTYAYSGGKSVSISAVLRKIKSFKVRNVLLTGGEPLLQMRLNELSHSLARDGMRVFIETNGSLSIATIDLAACYRIVMDIKTPGSGEERTFCPGNLCHLRRSDEIKFVITDHEDFKWAVRKLEEFGIDDNPVIMQPAWGRLKPALLAQWILGSGREIRLGIQLHKIIWPAKKRGV